MIERLSLIALTLYEPLKNFISFVLLFLSPPFNSHILFLVSYFQIICISIVADILFFLFRWLHGDCDQLRTEQDAEKCAAEGYVCLLCRPENTPPPHLAITPSTPPACSTPKQKIRLSPVQIQG